MLFGLAYSFAHDLRALWHWVPSSFSSVAPELCPKIYGYVVLERRKNLVNACIFSTWSIPACFADGEHVYHT